MCQVKSTQSSESHNKEPMGCEAQLAAQLYKHFYDDL